MGRPIPVGDIPDEVSCTSERETRGRTSRVSVAGDSSRLRAISARATGPFVRICAAVARGLLRVWLTSSLFCWGGAGKGVDYVGVVFRVVQS